MRARPPGPRALVFAPAPAVARWIERELAPQRVSCQHARTVEQAVDSLVFAPPPRPQLLIADLDAMTPVDVLQLHAIRDGWFGLVVALGQVSPELAVSLRIHRELAPPFADGSLAEIVRGAPIMTATTRIETVAW